MRKTAATVTAAGACLLGITGLGMGSAFADPSGAPTYRQFVAVGSDTTESLMDGLANAVTVNGTKVLGSYSASTGSSTVQSRGGTLSAATAVGDTTFTTVAPIYGAKIGDAIQLDSETATLAGTLPTASPYTYTVSSALTAVHASGANAIDTRCTFTRPVGSGAGRTALSNSITNSAQAGQPSGQTFGGCVDLARSSSVSGSQVIGGVSGGGTYIPVGFDAVTYATLSTSSVPKQLSIGQLKAIYQCTLGTSFKPMLPQSNSGTRQFFLQSIGLSSSALVPAGNSGAVVQGSGTGLGSCVDYGFGQNLSTPESSVAGTGFVENQGVVLSDSFNLIPFSTGQFIAQISGQQTNNLGRAAIRAISPATTTAPPTDARSSLYVNPTTSAQDPNAVFPITRDVYNVVETARITAGNARFDQALVDLVKGSSSLICTNIATIQKFGFNPSANCGATTITSP